MAERPEHAPVVEAVYPFEHGELDGVDAPPGPSASNHLGLEQPDDALGQSVVVGSADGSDRPFDSCSGAPLGILLVAERKEVAVVTPVEELRPGW